VSTPAAPAYFGDRAALYDASYDRRDADGYALRSRLAAVLRLAGDGPGEALDVGMGPGRLCGELDARGWTVSGVDAAPEMVEAARRRLPGAAQRLSCARTEELPFPPASFDLVTATGILEYAVLERALAEIVRVLRPGGRAVVSYPNPRALYGIWKTRAWYPSVRAGKRVARRRHPELPRGGDEIPPERFLTVLRSCGLEPVVTVHTSFLTLPTPLERLLPRTTVRIGERCERIGSGGRLLATQIVYETRVSGD